MSNKDKKLTLEDKTQMYWAMSLAKKQGKGPYHGATTEKAIKVLRDLEDSLGSHRALDSLVTNLLDDIISGNDVSRTPAMKEANFVPLSSTVRGKSYSMLIIDDPLGDGPKAA